MTRKQYLTRTEIAKMDGENKVHFLNPQARRRNKSLGDAAGGEPHDLRNIGAGLLRCLVVGQRLPFDVATYPEKGKRLYRMVGQPLDMADITAIENPAPRGRR